jgi:GNAT superfamily N-acetyltransferase
MLFPMQSFAFTIRKVSVTEAGDAFDVIDEYYNEIGVVVRDSRAELKRYLSKSQSGIWLAWRNVFEDAGTPPDTTAIGCIVLRPLTQIQNAGEIKRLYVRKSYRGLGVAKALLNALESYAAAQGMGWLYLDSKPDLEAAVRFYERSGYRRCERYNDNPQATIFMRKQLV